jgi:endoribonuclease Dicer
LNKLWKFNADKPRIAHSVSVVAMSCEEQRMAIEAFKAKTTQILIATDVVEEGLDVPSCNLVCSFNPIRNVKSFIQMQGRARDPSSSFLLLVPKSQVPSLSSLTS